MSELLAVPNPLTMTAGQTAFLDIVADNLDGVTGITLDMGFNGAAFAIVGFDYAGSAFPLEFPKTIQKDRISVSSSVPFGTINFVFGRAHVVRLTVVLNSLAPVDLKFLPSCYAVRASDGSNSLTKLTDPVINAVTTPPPDALAPSSPGGNPMSAKQVGTIIEVVYAEPTTNADGSPLADLAKTQVFADFGSGKVLVSETNALSPNGGGVVTATFTIPTGSAPSLTVQAEAVALDATGNQSLPLLFPPLSFDVLAPSAPTDIP